jgi:hypothetical protein
MEGLGIGKPTRLESEQVPKGALSVRLRPLPPEFLVASGDDRRYTFFIEGIKMIGYQVPAYRPSRMMASRPQMGSMSSMGGMDWLLLLGGAVVGGAGINGLVSQFSGPAAKPNAISVMVDLVLAGVGVALFVQKGSQAIS